MNHWLKHSKSVSNSTRRETFKCIARDVLINEFGRVTSLRRGKRQRVAFRREWGPQPRTLLQAFYGVLPVELFVCEDPESPFLHKDNLLILRKQELKRDLKIRKRHDFFIIRYTDGSRRRQKHFRTLANAKDWKEKTEYKRLEDIRRATRLRLEALALCNTIRAFANKSAPPLELFESLTPTEDR